MVWNKGIPAGLKQATELTRSGRLLEATALIQQVLRQNLASDGGFDPKPDINGAVHDKIVDVKLSEIREHPGLSPAQRVTANGLLQRCGPEPLLRSPSARDMNNRSSARKKVFDGQSGQFVSGS